MHGFQGREKREEKKLGAVGADPPRVTCHNKSDSPKYGFEALFLTERNQAS